MQAAESDDPAVISYGPVLPGVVPEDVEMSANDTEATWAPVSFAGLIGQGTGTEARASDSDQAADIMGAAYIQCCAARNTSITRQYVGVNIGAPGEMSGMTPVTEKVEMSGSLITGDEADILKKTFRGSRMCKGDRIVNESLTSTIDPLNLACITCEKEHLMTASKDPPIIVLTDQHMEPVVGGGCMDSCTATIRLENSSLSELGDILIEIFEGKQALRAGSVVLIGSFSHLAMVGAGKYANEWCKLVGRITKKFTGIQVCPMIPILSDNCEGSVVFELMMLGLWFSKIYMGNRSGMLNLWTQALGWVSQNIEGHAPLPVPFCVKVELPVNLEFPCTATEVVTFAFNSSSPSRLKKPAREAINGLIGTLADTLGKDFGLNLDPGANLRRITADTASDPELRSKSTIVTAGASILNRVSTLLAAENHKVHNLCVPGWSAVPVSIDGLATKLKEVPSEPDKVFVYDLLGNTSYRCLEYDGSTSMIKNTGSGYHVIGKVSMADDSSIRTILSLLAGILKADQEHFKVILPPLPRYLFSGCCADKDHCENLTDERHGEKLLGKIEHVRSMVKGELGRLGVKNFWVLNGVETLTGLPEGTGPAEKLRALRPVCANDGVHLTPLGYNRLAKGIVSCLDSQNRQKFGFHRSTGSKGAYWRGFLSPVGSRDRDQGRDRQRGEAAGASRQLRAQDRGKKYHPYGRGHRSSH